MFSFVIMHILNFLTILKGMNTAKVVIYVLIPLPFLLLTILFFKGIFLEGHTLGWSFLFTADWSKLYTIQIWRDAASQVFYSAGIIQNTVIFFSSHK
jgi:SNF family Na+-dependent transporter